MFDIKTLSCFQKQFESQRQTHSREVEELSAKLEEMEEKLWTLKNSATGPAPAGPSSMAPVATLPAPQPSRPEVEHTSTTAAVSLTHHRRQPSHGYDESRIDVTNMVREEGEVCLSMLELCVITTVFMIILQLEEARVCCHLINMGKLLVLNMEAVFAYISCLNMQDMLLGSVLLASFLWVFVMLEETVFILHFKSALMF